VPRASRSSNTLTSTRTAKAISTEPVGIVSVETAGGVGGRCEGSLAGAADDVGLAEALVELSVGVGDCSDDALVEVAENVEPSLDGLVGGSEEIVELGAVSVGAALEVGVNPGVSASPGAAPPPWPIEPDGPAVGSAAGPPGPTCA
jgi:hypothetical protein